MGVAQKRNPVANERAGLVDEKRQRAALFSAIDSPSVHITLISVFSLFLANIHSPFKSHRFPFGVPVLVLPSLYRSSFLPA
jgi:hypothetical protein